MERFRYVLLRIEWLGDIGMRMERLGDIGIESLLLFTI